METNFQLLMLSSNLLKSKILMLRVGGWGGGVGGNQFPTFDAELKFAKIQNSHVEGGGPLHQTGPNSQEQSVSQSRLFVQ